MLCLNMTESEEVWERGAGEGAGAEAGVGARVISAVTRGMIKKIRQMFKLFKVLNKTHCHHSSSKCPSHSYTLISWFLPFPEAVLQVLFLSLVVHLRPRVLNGGATASGQSWRGHTAVFLEPAFSPVALGSVHRVSITSLKPQCLTPTSSTVKEPSSFTNRTCRQYQKRKASVFTC